MLILIAVATYIEDQRRCKITSKSIQFALRTLGFQKGTQSGPAPSPLQQTKGSAAEHTAAGDEPLGEECREPAAPEPKGLQTGTTARRLITIERRHESGEEGRRGRRSTNRDGSQHRATMDDLQGAASKLPWCNSSSNRTRVWTETLLSPPRQETESIPKFMPSPTETRFTNLFIEEVEEPTMHLISSIHWSLTNCLILSTMQQKRSRNFCSTAPALEPCSLRTKRQH